MPRKSDVELSLNFKISEGLDQTLRDIQATLSKLEKQSKKTEESLTKGFDKVDESVRSAAQGFSVLDSILATAGVGVFTFGKAFQSVTKIGKSLLDFTNSFSAEAFKLSRSFTGFTEVLAIASPALIGFGLALKESTNFVDRLVGGLSILAGVIAGGFSFAIIKGTLLLAEFATVLGDKVVEASQKAANEFAEFESSTVVFNRTITNFGKSFGKSIGTLSKWEKNIDKLRKSTNFTRKELQTAVTELVAVGSQFKLNTEELEKLLEVSADYAALTKNDLVSTLLDLVSGLNGSSQSVIKYGIKLKDANIQQKLYDKGLKTNFRGLSETQKVQLRFNALLGQYAPIAGTAVAVTETLNGQDERLKKNLLELNTALGEGAALIERNNLLNLALNTTLDLVNENVFKLAGFIGALGGRVLQIVGFFGKWLFVISAVKNAISLLNVALSSSLVQSAFAKSIPFLNVNIRELVRNLGATNVSLDSVKNVGKSTFQIITSQSLRTITAIRDATLAFLGLSAATATFSTITKATFGKALIGIKVAVTGIAVILKKAFAPVILVILSVAGALKAIASALDVIDQKTGILSTFKSIFKDIFSGINPLFRAIEKFVNSIQKTFKTIIGTIFGGLVFALSKVLKAVLNFITKFDFIAGVLTDGTKKKINSTIKRLETLEKQLKGFKFDLFKLPGVKIGEPGEKPGENKIVDIEKLKSQLKGVQDQFKNFGSNQFQIIKKNAEEQVNIVKNSVANKIITEQEGADLIAKINADRLKKEEEAYNKLQDEKRKALKGFLNFIVSNPAQAIVDLVVQGRKPSDLESGAIAGGLAKAITQGASGAKEALTSTVKAIGNFFADGLGDALGPVFELFSQSPEEFRNNFTEFLNALPQLILNVVENLLSADIFVDALINAADAFISRLDQLIPKIIDSVINGLPRIITAFVRAVPRIVDSLIAQAPNIAVALIDSLVKESPRVITEMIKSIGKSAGRGFGLLGGGSGGGVFDAVTNVVSAPFKALGFAEGGMVPDGFPNDTFPARLSSRELVIDRSLTDKLNSYLDGQRGNNDQTGLLNAILVELRRPVTVESNLEIDNRNFGRVILELNRDNERLEA